jgi:hypothetical protein
VLPRLLEQANEALAEAAADEHAHRLRRLLAAGSSSRMTAG